MKNTIKVCASLVILGLLANSAFAAKEGGYAGLGIGASKLDTPNQDMVKNLHNFPGVKQSHEVGGLGGRIFAGYNFNRYVGLETGLATYAPSEYKFQYIKSSLLSKTLNYKLNSLDLVAKGYLPLNESGFNLYGLAGLAYVDSKVDRKKTFLGLSEKSAESQRKIRPIYGVGASYDIPNSQVTTNLELSHIQGLGNVKTSDSAIPSANLVSFNIAYNFS